MKMMKRCSRTDMQNLDENGKNIYGEGSMAPPGVFGFLFGSGFGVTITVDVPVVFIGVTAMGSVFICDGDKGGVPRLFDCSLAIVTLVCGPVGLPIALGTPPVYMFTKTRVKKKGNDKNCERHPLYRSQVNSTIH